MSDVYIPPNQFEENEKKSKKDLILKRRIEWDQKNGLKGIYLEKDKEVKIDIVNQDFPSLQPINTQSVKNPNSWANLIKK